MTALPLGSTFAEKYVVRGVLGEGGMGIVYRATHERLGQEVAIKTLLPELAKRPALVARFDREARAAAQLRSRHAVRVLDVGETKDGRPFMVMELLEGRDLSEELAERGPLPIGEAVGYVLQACAAMSEAHDRGIVHRDIKPSNLFLAREHDAVTLKVLDFGISKFEEGDGSALTATHAAIGSPLYMSPEQVRSSKEVDRRSDVWSIGVVLYQLLVGRPPFGGDGASAASVGASIVTDEPMDLRAARPEVPEALAAVVRRALAKRREDRFPDARGLFVALEPFADAAAGRIPSSPALPAAAQTAPTSRRGSLPLLLETRGEWAGSARPARRGSQLGIAAGVIALIAVLGGIIVALRARPVDATVLAPSVLPEPVPSSTASEVAKVSPLPSPAAAPSASASAAPIAPTPAASVPRLIAPSAPAVHSPPPRPRPENPTRL